VALANPEQVLTTHQTMAAMAPELRARCRELFPIRVRGRHEEIIACNVQYREDPDATETNLTRAALMRGRELVLKLTYGGELRVVRSAGEGLRIGRDRDNDFVVESHFASRAHARIYPREGHFVLQDLSSNGTYLLADGSAREILLRREEAVLTERGWIGLGNSATRHGDHTLRFRVEEGRTVEFDDKVRERQVFNTDDIGDFVIRRSDGTPAFFFCNAIDDAVMGVTLVVRGEDHLTNTPRQILLLQALGLPVPDYAHIALVVGADGAPLSKRTGSRSVQELREAGFLPTAIHNYLARLGHTYEDNGFMALDKLVSS